jgi:hypothetical protein
MYRKFLFQILLLCLCYTSIAQPNYQIGTSSVSIEPDNSIFSTALAGYGAPRAGRFTISWNHIGSLPEFNALAGLDGKLYAATSDDKLLIGDFAHDQLKWNNAGNAKNITSLATMNGKLYGTNTNNQFLEATISDKDISWTKKGKAKGIKSLTALGENFYALDDRGDLLKGSLTSKKVYWEKIKEANDIGRIISLTSDNNKLYAVNTGDSLWLGNPQEKEISWIQIGRNNSYTWNINVKNILAFDGRFLAVTEDNKLYNNQHSTEGNLTARTLAVKNQDNTTVVIVSLDLCGFEYSFADDIKAVVSKKHNIPKSAILINATHTHFAPITQEWSALGPFYSTPNERYLNDVVKQKVIDGIGQAINNMAPSKMYFGRGSTEIGLNRRIAANSEAPYDNVVDVLKIEDVNSNTRSILFLTGCHPVFKNSGKAAYTLSANYPAVARNIVEEQTNADNAIFIQGVGGDINPAADSYEDTGTSLADDALAVLNADMKQVKGDISHYFDVVNIPIKAWSIDQIKKFKKDNTGKVGDLVAERNVRWADLMLKNYGQEGKLPASLPVYVQTINIGDWKFIGLSREVVNEYGPAIRNIWPDKTVSVAGYCNDISSYLPNDWHVKTGIYEGEGSFFWYGAPGIFPENVMDIVLERIRIMNK